ncbi:MAG TPA: bacillithiol transferase BstA [Bacteroidota bacterium]|nr:bacillithiol transferase BstA [Bacteroidota bacterium]
MTDPRYPIGKFQRQQTITDQERSQCIANISEAPARLREAIRGLSEQQLNTPYRDGGWTVRQVVHHLPDSHLNAYIRFKLTMTEDSPPIKTYHENLWAELPDARHADVETSLALLDSLHARWSMFLRSLSAADFARTFRHPDQGVMNLDFLVQLYSWHGRHHVAQITGLKERMGWK